MRHSEEGSNYSVEYVEWLEKEIENSVPWKIFKFACSGSFIFEVNGKITRSNCDFYALPTCVVKNCPMK